MNRVFFPVHRKARQLFGLAAVAIDISRAFITPVFGTVQARRNVGKKILNIRTECRALNDAGRKASRDAPFSIAETIAKNRNNRRAPGVRRR